MAKITVDGTEYDTDTLSEDAKTQVQNVVFCDQKIVDLRNELAMIQTARNLYARNLAERLKGEGSNS
jgi:hypothetical protein